MAIKNNKITILVSALGGMTFGEILSYKLRIDRFKVTMTKAHRFESFLDLITRWVCLREIDRSILPILESEGVHSVAIYGMRTLGRCVINELSGSDIAVSYAIDDSKENMYSDIPVIATIDDYPPVDAIIVTSIQNFDEIKISIKDKTDARIFNLADLVNESYYKEFVK